MSRETEDGVELSSSWCVVDRAKTEASESPLQDLPSPGSSHSSSEHSDFEIFGEEEGPQDLTPNDEEPLRASVAVEETSGVTGTDGETSGATGTDGETSGTTATCQELSEGGDAEHECFKEASPAGQDDNEPSRSLRPAAAASPSGTGVRDVSLGSRERRLLLALRSLRGDRSPAGSASPSPLEPRPPSGHVQPAEPARIQIVRHSAEEESLPESDIQIEDSQNVGAGPELIDELMEGDRLRRYQHSPNANLNARLNGLVMCAVLFVLGLAVGHFLGSTHERFSNHFERVDRNDRIKSIQTELLQCARKYDELELQLNEVKATLVQKEYVDKWESLYQEGEEEKAALTATMKLYKSRYNTQKQLLLQCELKYQDLQERVTMRGKNYRPTCPPWPAALLRCPRQLAALKASMRTLLQLHSVGGPSCDLRALLPSWPALRGFVNGRFTNATALILASLPPQLAKKSEEMKTWFGQWPQLAKKSEEMKTWFGQWANRMRQKDGDSGKTPEQCQDPKKSSTEQQNMGKPQDQAATSTEHSDPGKSSTQQQNMGKPEDQAASTVDHGDVGKSSTQQQNMGKPQNQAATSTEHSDPGKSSTQQQNMGKPQNQAASTVDHGDVGKSSTQQQNMEDTPDLPHDKREFVPEGSPQHDPEEYVASPGGPPVQQVTDDNACRFSPRGDTTQGTANNRPQEREGPGKSSSESGEKVNWFLKRRHANNDDDDANGQSRDSEWYWRRGSQRTSADGSSQGFEEDTEPSDWLEAFMQLRQQMLTAQQRIWRSLQHVAARMNPRNGRRQKPTKRQKRKRRHR